MSHCHEIGHLSNVLNKCLVADEVDCRLVVKQEHILLELDLVSLDISDVGETDISETQLIGTSVVSFIFFD